MELSGSDMTFAGKVSSGSAPTSGSDLTNKTYVDSLAISGSATVGSDNNIYSTAPTTSLEGATFTPYGSARTYGKIAELNIGATLDYTSALHAGTTICTGTVKSALYPAWGSRWQGTARFSREAGRYEYVPVVLEFGQGGFFTMYCGQEATQSASTISINVRFTCIPHNA